jgi:hypothetical protein
MDPEKVEVIRLLAPTIAIICSMGVVGWVLTTWMRIKHGYPLEGSWGQKVEPIRNREADQQVKLLDQENAELRDELAAMKERLAVVERIVTDNSYGLTSQIEALRDQPEKELR